MQHEKQSEQRANNLASTGTLEFLAPLAVKNEDEKLLKEMLASIMEKFHEAEAHTQCLRVFGFVCQPDFEGYGMTLQPSVGVSRQICFLQDLVEKAEITSAMIEHAAEQQHCGRSQVFGAPSRVLMPNARMLELPGWR